MGNQLLGILAIGAGLALGFAALGELSIRLLMFTVAILLINYGLRLQGLPTIQTYLWMWWNMFRM